MDPNPINQGEISGGEERSKGPTIGAIIIVIILILGGIYLLLNRQVENNNELTGEEVGTGENSLTTSGGETTLDVSDLENEALQADPGSVDAELDGLDAELSTN